MQGGHFAHDIEERLDQSVIGDHDRHIKIWGIGTTAGSQGTKDIRRQGVRTGHVYKGVDGVFGHFKAHIVANGVNLVHFIERPLTFNFPEDNAFGIVVPADLNGHSILFIRDGIIQFSLQYYDTVMSSAQVKRFESSTLSHLGFKLL